MQQNSLINTIHKDNLATQIISKCCFIQATITSKELLVKVRTSIISLGKISLLQKIHIVLLEIFQNNLM